MKGDFDQFEGSHPDYCKCQKCLSDENVRRTDTKTCSVCGKTKALDGKNFYRNSTCGARYQKRYKKENPDKYRDTKLKHLYGITKDDFDRMLIEQGNKCAICHVAENKLGNGLKQNLVVDHNHTTKQVRGLLCHNCNKNVGAVESWYDEIKAYLEKYQK